MSRLETKAQMKLLREAREHLDNIKPLDETTLKHGKDGIELTEDHIYAWLEVFYDDRIMLDGCNHSKVKY